MSWLSKIIQRTSKKEQVVINDPRFDNWETVRQFEDLVTARAWRQHLQEAGIEAVLTSDWPLDRYGHGDIMLCVPPGNWSEAEELLSGLE